MLPKEAEDAPSLEAFKVRMDEILGSLIWCLATLAMARDQNWVIFKVPSSQNFSMVL